MRIEPAQFEVPLDSYAASSSEVCATEILDSQTKRPLVSGWSFATLVLLFLSLVSITSFPRMLRSSAEPASAPCASPAPPTAVNGDELDERESYTAEQLKQIQLVLDTFSSQKLERQKLRSRWLELKDNSSDKTRK